MLTAYQPVLDYAMSSGYGIEYNVYVFYIFVVDS